MSDLFSRLSAKLITFLHLKTKRYHFYVLALFTNLSTVAAILPVMAKLNVIFKVRIGEHLGISALSQR